MFVGAGSAGCGIAELFVKQLVREGLPETRARQHIFMVGRYGLLTEKTPVLKDFQKALSHDKDSYSSWAFEGKFPTLLEVVKSTKASILIGESGQKGLFTEEVVTEVAKHSTKPIIFPLSNPSDHSEATPSDIVKWTNGNVIVATGSPFPDVMFGQTRIKVTQCNNSYISPGLGLGIIASGANSVTDKMLMIASDTLANASDFLDIEDSHLLPSLKDLPRLSKEIAFYVAKVAMMEGNALNMADDDLRNKIEDIFWEPNYRMYSRTSN